VERLVDWIDQSLLYLHARALLPAFQISGVRTASDFIDIYQPQILVLDGGSAAPQALDIQARRQRLAALLKSQLVEPRVSEKLAPAYATAIDEAGVSTLLAATAQALVDASNIYHVRYWRQHEFEALPDDVERERTRADLRLMQGLPNEAIEIYNQVLQRFPSSHNTLLYRGLAYFQMRSYPRAIQDYQAALAGGGEHWHNRKTAFMELGRACREMESYAEARAWYEHALQQDPDFAEARLEMAYLQLTHLQEYEPAIQNLDLLAGGEYRKAEALANRGLARYSLYKQRQPAAQPDPALLAQAQADLTLALRLDPGLIAAYLNLAQVQIEQPAPILAIQTLTRAIPQIESQRSALEAGQVGGRGATAQALTENAYRVRLQRGNLYFNNQKYDLAAEDYRAAANLAPFDVAAVYNLGKAQQKLGLRSDAIRSFRETVRLKPGHAPAHQDLGDLLLQEHLQPDAEKAYATAYTLTVELKDLPGQALALLSLGRLYRTLPGREADAQRELERARRLGDNLEDEQLYTSATYELGVLLAASQPEQAAVLLDTSASLFELLKRPRESARAAAQLGVVLRKLNERPRSYEAFQRAGAQLYQVYDASNSEDQALEKLIKDGLKGAPRRPAGAPAGPAAPGEAGGAAAPAAPASPTVPAAPVSPEPGLQPAD
ncbi:MAG: tetratricopeptide repeat protein, partial [Chloroflexota bacterium]